MIREKDIVLRKQLVPGRKLHRLSIDSYPGCSYPDREASSAAWIQLPATTDIRKTWVTGPKFPKLDECTHFHYDTVTLADDFNVSLRKQEQQELHVSLRKCNGDQEQQQELQLAGKGTVTVYYVQVQCRHLTWTIARRYTDAATFDIQLHRCIFDRRYSRLPTLAKETDIAEPYTDAFDQLVQYFERFTKLVREAVHVKCGSVLNWLEMDNKGNHFLWHVNSGINVPAIAVATVNRDYVKREEDELELSVGDLVSIIDMPNVTESPWWRGKHSNKVGFFPSACVDIIPGSVHDSNSKVKCSDKQSSSTPLQSRGSSSKQQQQQQQQQGRNKEGLVCIAGSSSVVMVTVPTTDGTKKKKKGRLAVLFASRPDRDSLRQKGILRGRVFGAHLSEHLYDTETTVPLIVQVCCRTIEKHGIVEGVYRKSGVISNIQRLRQEFDSDSPPYTIVDERFMNDIHCVASLCKMYFRELPDPLLTFQLYDQFAEAVSYDTVQKKLHAIKRVVQQLPPYHYSTLAFLAQHLSLVASHATIHGMHSRNLALVWAPNLLKPLASESDASAFTEIKIQSVVLQFLIDHATIIFSDEDEKGAAGSCETPRSVRVSVAGSCRVSVSSNLTAGSCGSPLDTMSQTSSIQLIQGAGYRAQHRTWQHRLGNNSNHDNSRLSYSDVTEANTCSPGASADVFRSRTTSDLTHTSAARYQYMMKIPLMELAEAQRAHAVSESDLAIQQNKGFKTTSGFFRKENRKKKGGGAMRQDGGAMRHSQDYTATSSHWARTILNKFSIRRTQSLHRPVISGPCGFVADPYSTVLNNAQHIIPGVGLQEYSIPGGGLQDQEHRSASSKLSSVNSSAINSNVLLLGNVTNIENSSLDKSDFVNEWCTDTIRQFLDGKPLSSLQPANVMDRAAVTCTNRRSQCYHDNHDNTCSYHDNTCSYHDNTSVTTPHCEIRRSKSLPQKRRSKKNEDIAFVLKELQDISSREKVQSGTGVCYQGKHGNACYHDNQDNHGNTVQSPLNTILRSTSYNAYCQEQIPSSKRSSVNLEDEDCRPAKLARAGGCGGVRPVSCPSYSTVAVELQPLLRRAVSLRQCISSVVPASYSDSDNVVLIQQHSALSYTYRSSARRLAHS